jgi:hypothetical protein
MSPRTRAPATSTSLSIRQLADTEAYRTLEENLHKMGFERATSDERPRREAVVAVEDRARRRHDDP